MPRHEMTELTADVLIIGSEAGGGRAAIEAAKSGQQVALVNKSMIGKGGVTLMAVYSCNAALGVADPRDNPDVHFSDTVKGGHYISDQPWVEVYTGEAPARVLEMEEYGLRWSRVNGKIHQGWMPGESYPRALHVGWSTGPRFAGALKREVRRHPNIQVYNNVYISNLLQTSDGQVIGAVGIDLNRGEPLLLRAKATILATGGGMFLYEHTAGTYESTGDGYAYALRSGATLSEMEFVQFFPTACVYPKSIAGNEGPCSPRYFLNARLYNAAGERFMRRYDPARMELATRDMLARSIYREIKAGRGTPHGGVWMDLTFLAANIIEARLEQAMPGKWVWSGVDMLAYGMDPRKQAIEMAPVAHYFMGGIRVNEECATGVPGLFAAGEAITGIDGANRLAGNALSHCLVTGNRAGRFAAAYAQGEGGWAEPGKGSVKEELEKIYRIFEQQGGEKPIALRRHLQHLMWEQVGVIRDEAGLAKALEEIGQLRQAKLTLQNHSRRYNREWMEALTLENMLDVAEMITQAALERTETRGAHCRDDYPEPHQWKELKSLVLQRINGQLTVTPVPVRITRLRPELEETKTETVSVQGG